MKDLSIKKLYYSISEVSEMTHLKPYVLRYWESEFPQLRPSKNRAGKRVYRTSDIELILQIKNLLYGDKFTIEGARKRIREGKRQRVEPSVGSNGGESSDNRGHVISEFRRTLGEILAILDQD